MIRTLVNSHSCCSAGLTVDKASEEIGVVSCSGTASVRLVNGRPTEARFRV